jgi:hypothetical protein
MSAKPIHKQSIIRRLVVPISTVLLIILLTSIIYEHSWKLKGQPLLFKVTSYTTLLLFISIFFSTFFIYPMTFFRGAGTGERIIASLIPLFVWMVKEMIRIYTVFTIGESLYFGLNPMFLFLILFTFLQMGLSDLFCRWRLKRRAAAPVTIFSAHTLILLGGSILSLILFVAFLLKIGILYFDAYKTLFI